jgi:hypothetical protein
VHDEVALIGELEASREVAACAADAFRDRVELPAFAREERQDAVGLTERPPA